MLFSNNNCRTENFLDENNRSIYSIGDTLTIEDQLLEFSICHGDGNYEIGDIFSFSDFNGNLNGGDYKVSVVSMNATW